MMMLKNIDFKDIDLETQVFLDQLSQQYFLQSPFSVGNNQSISSGICYENS